MLWSQRRISARLLLHPPDVASITRLRLCLRCQPDSFDGRVGRCIVPRETLKRSTFPLSSVLENRKQMFLSQMNPPATRISKGRLKINDHCFFLSFDFCCIKETNVLKNNEVTVRDFDNQPEQNTVVYNTRSCYPFYR